MGVVLAGMRRVCCSQWGSCLPQLWIWPTPWDLGREGGRAGVGLRVHIVVCWPLNAQPRPPRPSAQPGIVGKGAEFGVESFPVTLAGPAWARTNVLCSDPTSPPSPWQRPWLRMGQGFGEGVLPLAWPVSLLPRAWHLVPWGSRAPGPDAAEGCLRLAPQQTPGSTSHSCIPLHVSSRAHTLTFQHPGPAIPTSAMWVRTASAALGRIPQILLRSQGPEVCQGFIAILGSRTRDWRRPHSVSAAGAGRCRPRPCPATHGRSRIGPGLSQRELGCATQPGAGCARCCQPGHGAHPMGRGWQLERLHSKGWSCWAQGLCTPQGLLSHLPPSPPACVRFVPKPGHGGTVSWRRSPRLLSTCPP